MLKVGYTRIGGPEVLPTGGAPFDCKFSPANGTYLAVVGAISPSLLIYKRSGDVFTKITDPIQSPSGTTAGCAFSTDGVYLAVAGYSSPRLYIYKHVEEDTFMKLPDPAEFPGDRAYGCAFGGEYLAVVGEYGVYIYKKNGDEFIRISEALDQIPSGVINKCVFSSDGQYLVIVYTNFPHLSIFKRNGDEFVKLDNPSIMPTGAGRNCAFTPDGSYLVVTYQTAPYLTVYKRSGNSFVAMSSPTVLPTGPAWGCALTSRYMAVAHWESPYLRVYERDEDVYKTVNITDIPLGSGFSCAFTPDGEYLAVGARPSLSISDFGIYKRVYSPVIQGSIVFRGHASANFGNPIKTATGKITFRGRAILRLIGLVLRELEGIYQISSSEIISRNQPVLSTDLANYIEVWINPMVPAAEPVELYRTKEDQPEEIPANSSKTFAVDYDKKPAINIVAALEDETSPYVTITDAKLYGGSAEITISNSTGSPQTCTLIVTGKPLEVQGRRKIVVKDEESILDHGLVKYEFDSPLVQDETSARDIGEKILRMFSVARANIEIEWRGDPALELADIVQIPEFEKLGITKKENFYITRQEYKIEEGGMEVNMTGRKVPPNQ